MTIKRVDYYKQAKQLGYSDKTYWPYGTKEFWKEQVEFLKKPLYFIPVSYISKLLGYCKFSSSDKYIEKLKYFNNHRIENRRIKQNNKFTNKLPKDLLIENINKIENKTERFCKLGNLYEEDGIKLYKKKIYIDCEYEEQKDLFKIYKSKSFNFIIIGKCDLYNKTLNEIIEVKSRMNKLADRVYDNEYIQLQFYLHLLGIREGKLLEHINGKYNIHDIIYNKKNVNYYIDQLYLLLKNIF